MTTETDVQQVVASTAFVSGGRRIVAGEIISADFPNVQEMMERPGAATGFVRPVTQRDLEGAVSCGCCDPARLFLDQPTILRHQYVEASAKLEAEAARARAAGPGGVRDLHHQRSVAGADLFRLDGEAKALECEICWLRILCAEEEAVVSKLTQIDRDRRGYFAPAMELETKRVALARAQHRLPSMKERLEALDVEIAAAQAPAPGEEVPNAATH